MIRHARSLLVLAAASGAVTAAAAAPARPPAHSVGYDVRPLLAAHPVPELDVGRRPARRPAAASPDADAVIDDFESPLWPDDDLWLFVGDLDGTNHGEYYWGRSACRAAGGALSLWAIGDGQDGGLLNCGAEYANGVLSSAIFQLDLTGYADAGVLNLAFDYWLNTRIDTENNVAPDGLFVNFIEIDAEGGRSRVVLDGITSKFPDRFFDQPRRLDLLNATEIYEPHRQFNFAGQSILLEFLFISSQNQSVETEGSFIDNLRLEADVEPQATSTVPTTPGTPPATPPTATESPTVPVTPTVTVTATVTMTPTVTITPTVTAAPTITATATPTVPTVYLPVVYNAFILAPPSDTPTAAATMPVSPTATVSVTATATVPVSPTVTVTTTATPTATLAPVSRGPGIGGTALGARDGPCLAMARPGPAPGPSGAARASEGALAHSWPRLAAAVWGTLGRRLTGL